MTQLIDRNKKNSIVLGIALIVSALCTPFSLHAQGSVLDTLVGKDKQCNYVDDGFYKPHSDITRQFPIFGTLLNSSGCVDVKNEVTDMFVTGFRIFLGIVSIFAVVNISIAGIQYMIQEKDTTKLRGAKKRLTQSVIGLILAFSGFVILNSVNSRLVNVGFDLRQGVLGNLIQKGAAGAAGNIAPVTGECIQGTSNCTPGGTGGGTAGGGTGGSTGGGNSGQLDNEYLKQKISESGITGLNPNDIRTFFPDGQSTPENWLKLAKAIAQEESGFKANKIYAEGFGSRPPAGTPGRIPESEYPRNKDGTVNPGKLSIGLFALSWDDKEVVARGYTERDLQDPNKNLEVGIAIMKRVIENNGCIACASMSATYWSVLKNKQEVIKDYIRNN